MPPDYSEILEARAAQSPAGPGPTPQQLTAFLRESARGATVLTELLEDPGWNVFRSTIGGDLERAEAERAVLRERMEGGELVGDDRARAELRLQYLRGVIEQARRAMELPKTLIDRHAAMETLAGQGGGANGRAGGTTATVPPDPNRGGGDSTPAPVVKSAAGAGRTRPRPKGPAPRRKRKTVAK